MISVISVGESPHRDAAAERADLFFAFLLFAFVLVVSAWLRAFGASFPEFASVEMGRVHRLSLDSNLLPHFPS